MYGFPLSGRVDQSIFRAGLNRFLWSVESDNDRNVFSVEIIWHFRVVNFVAVLALLMLQQGGFVLKVNLLP